MFECWPFENVSNSDEFNFPWLLAASIRVADCYVDSVFARDDRGGRHDIEGRNGFCRLAILGWLSHVRLSLVKFCSR